MSGRDWKRLGYYVARRRYELGYKDVRAWATAWSQDGSGTHIHEKTLLKLERGESVGRSTRTAVETYLGWQPGTCERILDGGVPTLDKPVIAVPVQVELGIPDDKWQWMQDVLSDEERRNVINRLRDRKAGPESARA